MNCLEEFQMTKLNVTLTPNDVKEAIAFYVAAKMPRLFDDINSSDVTLNVKMEYIYRDRYHKINRGAATGNAYESNSYPKFTGATITNNLTR